MASTDAPLFKLAFKAGFHRESTRYSEEGRWYDGDHVRFREGRPENIGGYTKKTTTEFEGTARDLLLWTDNDGLRYAGFGTEKKLYIYDNNLTYDITPIRAVSTLTSSVWTSVGGSRVKVSLAAHGAIQGDFVEVSMTTTVGGNIILSDTTFGGPVYEIVSAPDANNFFVSVLVAASATETSAGVGEASFLISTEQANSIQGLGFGAGVFNAGVSTTGRRAWSAAASSSDFIFLNNQWSLDNFGEDMLALRRGGQIYIWDKDGSILPQRATVVTASPTVSDFVLVAPNSRHVITLGCTGFADIYSPLRVRWSDQNNYNNWTPSVSSTSGEVELGGGTKLIGGVKSRNQINIWTDRSMYAMQYVGNPFIFNFRMLGSNCGLVGPHAAVDYDGRAFWMSDDNFYVFDGQVRNLKSTIRRYVYENINEGDFDKVYAGVNSEFKEIVWLYPSASSNECDSYVLYNPEEDYWVYGTSKWSAFEDHNNIFDNTITAGTDNYIYDNEPKDVYTADGVAIENYLESSSFDMDEGAEIMFVDKIIPDFTFSANGQVSFTLTTKQYPNGTETVKGPYVVQQGTEKIDLRARGRQARVRVSTATSGTSWRWGAVRMAGQPDGKR
jgi:hypothetical protein